MGLLKVDDQASAEISFSNKICVEARQLPETYEGDVKDKQFYSQCFYGDRRLKTDSFVLVTNEKVLACDTASNTNAIRFARILFFYRDEQRAGADSYRAIVQPIVRPIDITKHLKAHPYVTIDVDHELIIDMPEAITDIAVRNCTGRFNMLYCNESQSAADELRSMVSKDDMYVCRYKIIKLNGNYCLLPWTTTAHKSVAVTQNKENTPHKNDTNKRKITVTPIKIINNSVHKVRPRERLSRNTKHPTYAQSDDEPTASNNGNDSDCLSPQKRSRHYNDSNSFNHNNNNNNNITPKPSACKNLNVSLNTDGTSDSDLKYSIEKQDNLKVKITIRDRQSKIFRNVSPDVSDTPTRRSRRLSTYTDTTSRSETPIPDADTPRKRGRPRKSVLKTPSLRDPETTSRSETPIRVGDALKDVASKPTSGRSRNSILKTPSLRDHDTTSRSETPIRIPDVIKVVESRAPNLDTPQKRGRPRKSILKTPSLRDPDTPKRSVRVSTVVEERLIERYRQRAHMESDTEPDSNDDNDNDHEYRPSATTQQKRTPSKRKSIPVVAPKSPKTPRTPSKSTVITTTPRKSMGATTTTPSQVRRQIREGLIAPAMQQRERHGDELKSDVQLVKESLHVSAVPKSLPCRETEFSNIESFIECKILDECGGCMYVSGVPGTGKTATVTEVIRALQLKVKKRQLPDFEFVEINGMKMTEPRQAYVHIYRQLTGKTMGWEQAHTLLEHRFTKQAAHRKTTVLLVDELDILCNRRQDVVYNILDWPTKMAARLVVVTIANTMDLPERLLMGKITSRLGLTRLTFQPYSHKQLQEVVMARLAGTSMFKSDAVQLVARKVASVSGDCRRALDICRRSIEIAETATKNGSHVLVSMVHVQQAFTEMISSSKVQAIKGCSKMEQFFLQAVEAEVTRTGVEETSFLGVYTQFESILILMGMKVPAPGRAMLLSTRLGATKLIICESACKDVHQKILLNVSPDDIHYALHAKI